jgi:hypothetical protein
MRRAGRLTGHRLESQFLLEAAGVVSLVQAASPSWATLFDISIMDNASIDMSGESMHSSNAESHSQEAQGVAIA